MPCAIPGDEVANSNATTANANRCVRPTRFAHAVTICVPYDAGRAMHTTLQLLAVAPFAVAQDERSCARSPHRTRTPIALPIWYEALREVPVIRLSARLLRRQAWTRQPRHTVSPTVFARSEQACSVRMRSCGCRGRDAPLPLPSSLPHDTACSVDPHSIHRLTRATEPAIGLCPQSSDQLLHATNHRHTRTVRSDT